MSITYTPTTNFGSKDVLPANDPNKVIVGAEFTSEFNAIQAAFALAAPTSNPTFSGTATYNNLTVSGSFTSRGIDDNADATAITIDANENVGIGVLDPASYTVAPELVVDTGASGGITILGSGGTGSYGGVFFGDGTGADAYRGFIQYNHNNSGSVDALILGTAGAECMRIDSTGNVGIGGTPSTPLHVFGDMKLEEPSPTLTLADTSDGSTHLLQSVNTALNVQGAGQVRLTTAGTERMRVDASGNVGVGNTNPSRTLDIGDGTSSAHVGIRASSSPNILFTSGGANVGYIGTTLWNTGAGSDTELSVRSENDLTFTSGSTERMRIDSSGNVGIGTNNPRRKLEVADTGAAIVSLQSTDSDNCQIFFGDAASETAGKVIYRHDTNSMSFETNSAERMVIDSSGNVGVGVTSPTAKLHLLDTNPAIRMQSNGASTVNAINMLGRALDSTAQYSTIKQVSTNGGTFGTLAFCSGPSDTEHMRISTSGDVGIGTTTPTAPLTIQADSGAQSILVKGRTTDGIATLGFYAQDGTQSQGYLQGRPDSLRVWANPGDFLSFGTGGTESMRVDDSGNLLIGRTTTANASTDFGTQAYSNGVIYQFAEATGNSDIHRWHNGAGTKVAYLQGDGDLIITGTYSPSDERLKENIVDAPAGNLDDLRVRSYDWKADGSSVTHGFIAQELEVVAPYAVNKGETEDDMMAVDYSKLVPMLVKEIQDLKAKVEALENA